MRSLNTPVMRVRPARPSVAAIAYAADIVRRGGIVAFPTETVYGLAANLLDKKAISRLYRVKHRVRGKPFTVLIADTAMIAKMGCRLNKEARLLIKKYWPGPLTILLRSRAGKKVGFRMPANKAALWLAAATKVPIAAPSANLSGTKPPKSARSVMKQLAGKIDLVIDGGRTKIGIASTVVDLSAAPAVIVREGAIKKSALSKLIAIR